jgi:phosphotransferase system enzyme I (PtsI)
VTSGEGTSRPDVLHGIAGSPGVVFATAVVVGDSRATQPHRRIAPSETEAEQLRFAEAVRRAKDDLRAMAAQFSSGNAETSILEAYVMMVGDETLATAVHAEIGEGRCAEWAVARAIDAMAFKLSAAGDAYLRERSHDVEWVGERLLRAFGDDGAPSSHGHGTMPRISGPSVIVARDLSPADTAAMVHQPIVGFVTEMGTRTSHTSIMARALEIPAVVGVTDATRRISTGDVVIIDGLRGQVIVQPTEAQMRDAEARSTRYVALARGLMESRDRPPETQDGARIALRANVELPAEAILARDQGADGIGLYRTEFLYIDRAQMPDEDEQYEIFRAVVEATRPRPVVLRTFDIGGDKFASTFKMPPEVNPMLGLRAVRLALSRPDVFLDHLRAMVRASAHGDVRIMVPMVASLGELRQVRAMLKEAIDDVHARGLPHATDIPLGVMIEVPAAAVMVDLFAREAAFLSLGTNDLIQYALAVDRTSRSLAYLASPFDPAIIHLIAGVVRAGRAWSRPVSICGAMASDPLAAILLLGLGLRDFSMEAAAIPEIREALRRVSVVEAEGVAREALAAETAEEVEHVVAAAFAPRLYDLLTGEA